MKRISPNVVKQYAGYLATGWMLVIACLCATKSWAEEFQYSYPVSGSTMQELVNQIENNSHSPAGAFGYTKLNTNLSWKSIENQDGVCSVDSATFSYDITIYMPEWIDMHNAKQCLQHNWQLVWNDVQLHEEEHRRIYRLLDQEDISQQISAIEPQASCELLTEMVNAEMKLILDANDKLHDQFHALNIPPTLWGC